MPNIANKTPAEARPDMVTVGPDNTLEDGDGNELPISPGKLIYKDQYSSLSLDLNPFANTRTAYAVHVYSQINGERESYRKILWLPTQNVSKVVESINGDSGAHDYEINNGILSDIGGGGRDCAVRIERLASSL